MWPLKKRTALDPAEDPTSIGNLAVTEGLVSRDVLEVVLSEFQHVAEDQLLGQFLVTHTSTSITTEQLELLLLKQTRCRNGGKTKHSDVMLAFKLVESAHERRSRSVDTLVALTIEGVEE